jgi:hypothetical protein
MSRISGRCWPSGSRTTTLNAAFRARTWGAGQADSSGNADGTSPDTGTSSRGASTPRRPTPRLPFGIARGLNSRGAQASVIVTAILTPLLTAWWYRRLARTQAVEVAKPEHRRGRHPLTRNYFASGSGRTWNFITLLVVPLPVSMWNGVLVDIVVQMPRPFQPALGSSMRPSIHFV